MNVFALIFDLKQTRVYSLTSYCVIFSSLVVDLTKWINSLSASQKNCNYFLLKKRNFMCIKVNVLHMEKDKYFSSLSYSICKGVNFFFYSNTQRKKRPMVRKKPYLSPLSKNGDSGMTLELKPRMRKFSLLNKVD